MFSAIEKITLIVIAHTFNPRFGELRQEDSCEIEDSLGYIALDLSRLLCLKKGEEVFFF